jgi:hypothetical protein
MISTDYWLEIARGEYLNGFISQGGAAVKFLVPAEGREHHQLRDTLRDELRSICQKDNFSFISVDAASTKIHLIDRLFHEIAKQIEWDNLAYVFLQNLLSREGYTLSSSRSDFKIRRLAELNEIEETFLRIEINKLLTKHLFKDFEMSQEFRRAMIRLCLAELDKDNDNLYMIQSIKGWLRGDLRLISVLKPALIHQKIARHNARHMLFSLAHWIRVNGMNGLVLCIDISRYLITGRKSNYGDGFYYTAPATLDAYEVLRQFIDGTDEMEGLFIAVIASREFLTDERRGLNRYDALKLRIWDEVRDRNRQNPLSSLIRLS